MEDSNIIKIENVSKKIGFQQVLNQVNLNCKVSTITGIIGRNGSGKSVLFKCICGLMKVDSGKIYIYNKDINNNNFYKDLGVIINEPAFLKQYSGIKNLELLYMIRNNNNRKHLYYIMETVGLDPESKKPVGKYSLGMKQRLAIAQAIMEDQKILILDEPMNGLDNQGVVEIRHLLIGLKEQGVTILLTSHNKEDIAELCDVVYEIDLGELKKISNK